MDDTPNEQLKPSGGIDPDRGSLVQTAEDGVTLVRVEPSLTFEAPVAPTVVLKKDADTWTYGSPDDANAVLVIDPVDVGNVEVGPFMLDDVQLARLVALLDAGATVLLKDREPFIRQDPTPAEMQAIQQRADELRETLGDRAAQEYIEAATVGADV